MTDSHACPRCERPLADSNERVSRCRYCGWRATEPPSRRPEGADRSNEATGLIGAFARGVASLLGTLFRLALIVAVLSFVAIPFGGTGVPALDEATGEAAEAIAALSASVSDPDPGSASPISEGGEGSAANVSAVGANASTSNPAIDRAATERYIHQYINQERTERGLEPVEFDSELREVARYYSARMAREEFFSHTAPDGGTLADRYDRFEYDCRVATGNGRITTGGENLAYTYYETRVRTDGGVEVYDTERELARGIVDGWMNSTGHRKNLLRPYWEAEGIGVYAIEDDGRLRVYATQHFC
jgi:uncharacterized protein YkwD